MISKGELDTCKERVEALLEEYPSCRNSDKMLISKYLEEFHKLDLPPEVLSIIPSFESITRVRRKLQEEGKFKASTQVESKREEQQREVSEWSVEA